MHKIKLFPELSTPRLHLRRISATDQAFIFKGMSDPNVVQFYGSSYQTLGEAKSLMDWFEFIVDHGIGVWWGICLSDTPTKLIGACGIHDWEQQHHSAELGFWLLPQYWHQGFMGECLQTVLPFCFSNLDIHRLQARIQDGNIVSQQLLQRAGFQREGVLRGAELKQGTYINLHLYARLATDDHNLLNNTQLK